MYDGGGVVLGASTTAAGALVLPNTGGHVWLAVVAVASIAVGAAIVLSTVARLVVKHLPKV